jgi:hypothetical protein
MGKLGEKQICLYLGQDLGRENNSFAHLESELLLSIWRDLLDI